MSGIDIIVFLGFIVAVILIGTLKSRKEDTSEDYFLAGRGLGWWLIGFSLIAANISTEQFVGMSGSAAGPLGLAIASYEWMAAITLVVVAFVFLPKFLRCGIYTIPEFMEYRYNEATRSIMALFTMIIYVFVTISAVIYSGALTINTLFAGQSILGVIPINVTTASWLIGLIAAGYVAFGGLKACAWADLLQGSALIIGGALITWLAFDKLGDSPVAALTAAGASEGNLTDAAGGFTKFMALNKDKLHMVLPASNKDIPWTALVVGLWIPNFYYWGLNQYITQRTLGSKSLSQGQKGVVFAAALKIIIPFVIVFPGLIAFNLYSDDMADEAMKDEQIKMSNQSVWQEFEQIQTSPEMEMIVFDFDKGYRKHHPEKAAQLESYNRQVLAEAETQDLEPETRNLLGYKYDSALGMLIGKLVPAGRGLQGFILAALLGAVVSSLASMLNSASTIFTMDMYRKYISKDASQKTLVAVGRICVGVFVVIGCLISPLLADPKYGGIFKYIQEFQGFISPGILCVFVFGLLFRKAPSIAGVVGLVLNPIMYGLLKKVLPNLSFLDRMAVCFGCVFLVMVILTLIMPRKTPLVLPEKEGFDMRSSRSAKAFGIVVLLVTVSLYILFW